MGFIDKTTEIITGKTSTERLQEKAANNIIRAKMKAAELKEIETQSIRLAQERIRAKANYKIKQARSAYNGGNNFGGMFGQIGNSFGQSSMPPISKGKKRTIYVKKGKHYVKKTIRSSPGIAQPTQQSRQDILGFGGFGSGKGYRVI